MDIITLENISKKFGKKVVLDDIFLNIKKGDFLAVTGLNGSGKTTLINIISNSLTPTTGKIISKIPKNKVGIQIQDAIFDNEMYVKDYIELYKDIYSLEKNDYLEIIQKLKLDKILNLKIKKLSGGQKQKLNIVISLMHNPELVIFDELTTGLDSFSRYEIRKILKELNNEGTTIILISHYMDEIEYLCNRVILLYNTKILFDLEIEDVYRKYNIARLDELFYTLVENGELSYE